MTRLNGTVRFRDLETGLWLLEAEDGRLFVLAGGDRQLKKNGARVSAEGDIDDSSPNLAMAGPRFVVKAYSFL